MEVSVPEMLFQYCISVVEALVPLCVLSSSLASGARNIDEGFKTTSLRQLVQKKKTELVFRGLFAHFKLQNEVHKCPTSLATTPRVRALKL